MEVSFSFSNNNFLAGVFLDKCGDLNYRIFINEKTFLQLRRIEVARLKSAIAKAEREGLDPQVESEVQDIIRGMIVLMPFADKFRELGQLTQSCCSWQEWQAESNVKEEWQRVFSLLFELESDKTFKKFYKTLQKQGISELPFLKE